MSLASYLPSKPRFTSLRYLIMPALLLAATVSPAAISFVQQNYAVPQTPQSSVSVIYTAAEVAGDTNIVAIGWNDATSSPTGVDRYQRGTFTPWLWGRRVKPESRAMAIYVAKNVVAAAAGANTVTVTFNAAVPYADVRILSYRGLDTFVAGGSGRGCSGHGNDAQLGIGDHGQCQRSAVRGQLCDHASERQQAQDSPAASSPVRTATSRRTRS